MNLRFTAEEEAFRKEVAEFLDKEFTAGVKAEKISTGDMAQARLPKSSPLNWGKRGGLDLVGPSSMAD